MPTPPSFLSSLATPKVATTNQTDGLPVNSDGSGNLQRKMMQEIDYVDSTVSNKSARIICCDDVEEGD
jgi:hypothetical protein